MKYIVTARFWTPELEARFGAVASQHELAAGEVLALIAEHGRASVGLDTEYTKGRDRGRPGHAIPEGTRNLHFENDYD